MKPLELIEQGRFLGEEFLVWLWMRGLREGGTSGVEGDLSSCFVEDAVILQTERGDVKELSLRKGSPAESRAAGGALSRGMRPSKAKLRIISGDMDWVFSLSAATLDLSTISLPPVSSKDPMGRLADRLFLLEEGTAHLERRFASFLHLRSSDPEALQEDLRGWIRASLAGQIGEPDEVPWEG